MQEFEKTRKDAGKTVTYYKIACGKFEEVEEFAKILGGNLK